MKKDLKNKVRELENRLKETTEINELKDKEKQLQKEIKLQTFKGKIIDRMKKQIKSDLDKINTWLLKKIQKAVK